MIIVTGEDIVLESSELATLDAFIRTHTGQRVLKALAAQRPPILGDAFSAGRAAGYEEAISNFFELVGKIPEVVEDKVSNYPDLDNDEAWKEEVPNKSDSPTQE